LKGFSLHALTNSEDIMSALDPVSNMAIAISPLICTEARRSLGGFLLRTGTVNFDWLTFPMNNSSSVPGSFFFMAEHRSDDSSGYSMYIPFEYSLGSLAARFPHRESSDSGLSGLLLTERAFRLVFDDSSVEELSWEPSVSDDLSPLLDLPSDPESEATRAALALAFGSGHSLE
jgi:hypothetical protein